MTLSFSSIGGASTLLPTNEAHASIAQTFSQSQADAQTVFNETNKWREWSGMDPLALNPKLNEVAQSWSNEISERQKQDHNPDYSAQIPAGWLKAGENIGYAFSAEELVESGWLQSKSHNENIYGDYTDVGIGVTYDSKGNPWYVAVFAKYDALQVPPVTAHTELRLSETSVRLNWENPQVKGSIKHYIVDITDAEGNSLKQQMTFEPTITITGLEEGATYKYNVTTYASSSDGKLTNTSVSEYWKFSTAESPVVTPPETVDPPEVIPPEVTDPGVDEPVIVDPEEQSEIIANLPHELTVTSSSSSTLEAEWGSVEIEKGSLDTYTVLVFEQNKLIYSAKTLDTVHTVEGLKANTNYQVAVSANVTSPDGVNTQELMTNTVQVTTADVVEEPVVLSNKASSSTPQSFTVKPAYDSLQTSWKAPKTVVGKITGYTVTVTGLFYHKSYTTTAESLDISGLRANNIYLVTVTAKVQSDSGKVKASSPLTAKLVMTPASTAHKVEVSAVQNLKVSKVTKSDAEVSFTAPKTVTGKITSYTIDVTGNGSTKSYTNQTGKLDVSNLKANTKYTVKVTAHAVSADNKNTKTSSASTTFTTLKK